MAKYVVVERGYEYNDEYNSFNESESYSIKSKLYNTENEAKEIGKKEAILSLFKDWKGIFDSSNFDFKSFDQYDNSTLSLEKYFKENNWEFDKEGYELYLPKDLSEEDVIKAYNKWDEGLFEIIKIEE